MDPKKLKQELKKYVPNLILQKLEKDPSPIREPSSESYLTSFLFLDIVEFSKLTEIVVEKYENGLELISNILSLYLEQLIRIITNAGGDIVKFVGDALFVIWVADNQEELPKKIYKAVLCGLQIQKKLFQFPVGEGIRLSVRIGISCGKIYAMQVGGAFDRWEFVITGEALNSSARAQKLANPGEIRISKKAWSLLEKDSLGKREKNKFILKSPSIEERMKILNDFQYREYNIPDSAIPILKNYVPRAILTRMDEGHDSWHIDFLQVSILFIKVGSNRMENLSKIEKVQEIMMVVQKCIYTYEGSINRFGVDDKGAVILTAFGLPPLIHSDDPIKTIEAAIYVEKELQNIGYDSKMGIATGKVLCGTVGNEIRSEYTMHGTNVNFAARLMQISDGIICDETTYLLTKKHFQFKEMPPRIFKGKLKPVVYYKLIER
ncbi:MAG: adenylate/guanylate cyclase domain-containing protein [Leptonema sp. (in: bacteria)]